MKEGTVDILLGWRGECGGVIDRQTFNLCCKLFNWSKISLKTIHKMFAS